MRCRKRPCLLRVTSQPSEVGVKGYKEENMKAKMFTWTIAITSLAALAIPLSLAAQDNRDHDKHHHYKLIDLGTFGGPSSYVNFNPPLLIRRVSRYRFPGTAFGPRN